MMSAAFHNPAGGRVANLDDHVIEREASMLAYCLAHLGLDLRLLFGIASGANATHEHG